VDLAATLEDVHALLGGDDWIAVEVGSPLLELGEVLDRLERALGAEEPLDVNAPEARVSIRRRNSWGRMSPTRWKAASVWPLT